MITGLAVVYTVGFLLAMPDPDWAYLARGVIHLGELAALVALGFSGAAGTGLLGRPRSRPRRPRRADARRGRGDHAERHDTSETLFAIAPPARARAGAGRDRRDPHRDLDRAASHACSLGVYVFAVLTPRS